MSSQPTTPAFTICTNRNHWYSVAIHLPENRPFAVIGAVAGMLAREIKVERAEPGKSFTVSYKSGSRGYVYEEDFRRYFNVPRPGSGQASGPWADGRMAFSCFA